MSDKPVLCYAAEPIDQTSQRAGWRAGWALTLDSLIHSRLVNIYRPADAWRAPTLDPRVELVNRCALDQADLVVACLPAGVPSIGVPSEIALATARGVPAIVLTDLHSQALAGNSGVTVVRDPDEVLGAVKDLLLTVRARQAWQTYDSARPLSLVIGEGHEMPSRAYDDDAGFDLTVVGDHKIDSGQFRDLPSQVEGVQTPPGTWLMITGRSSTLRRLGLHIPVAVIDHGWRGPLLTGVWNLGRSAVQVFDGTRLAQAIPISVVPHRLTQVKSVEPHPRGLNGFGSTG